MEFARFVLHWLLLLLAFKKPGYEIAERIPLNSLLNYIICSLQQPIAWGGVVVKALCY